MEFTFARKKDQRTYLHYTVLFLVLAACIFAPYLISGHTLIWNTDAFNQHLPLMIKYREYLLQFLRHPFQGPTEWSWTMGVGSDLFSVFSYYTIGDVFAYLTLLFPTSHLIFAYQLIIVLRMYCVGLAFVYFARHFDFSDWIILSGAAVYMVNAYLLYAAVAQPMFTTTFILFPLIVVNIERVLQGGSAWPLTGVFFWMLVSNYYLAFVLGLGAMLYLALRWGLDYWGKIPFWPTIRKFAFAAGGSVLTAAVLLIPEIIGVINSTRTGSEFANGMVVYPFYYYLLLPKQLINGDNWKLMFWSALGLASVILLAITYLYANWKKHKTLAAALFLGLVMLLIPAVGAAFNGGMSASNRWTLLLYLPLAMTVMIFLRDLTLEGFSPKMIRLLATSTGIYLVYLAVVFFIQNDDKLFLPVIFLLLALGLTYLISENKVKQGQKAFAILIILNVCLNAAYAALPYNGSFASAMLNRGEYEQIAEKRYGGLEEKAAAGNYRINTVSNNKIVSRKKVWNDLTSNLANISSYYSIQNAYLGQFSTDMQNIQYDNNIPLHQVDDRTILNNFLGVRYIFVQTNGLNAKKIPATYKEVAASKAKQDYDADPDQVQVQTKMYESKSAFPLVWLESKTISPAAYRQLPASGKERALASGVVVSRQDAGKLAKAKLGGVKTIQAALVSNRGNIVNPSRLKYTDSKESYSLRLFLTKKQKAQLGKSELHLEFRSIKYQPFTFAQQLKYELKRAEQNADLKSASFNRVQNRYKYLRYHLLAGSPDISYSLTVTGSKAAETISQPSVEATSFFRLVKGGTMNLGVYSSLPSSLILKPSKLGVYQLDYRIVAVPINKTYKRQVKQIRQNGLKHLKLGQDQLTGTITAKKAGILTSSIPYSSGWSAVVDGKAAKVILTNNAFLGLKLAKGKHKVAFYYHTPGLLAGFLASLLGLLWLGSLAILEKKRKKQL